MFPRMRAFSILEYLGSESQAESSSESKISTVSGVRSLTTQSKFSMNEVGRYVKIERTRYS